MNEMKKIKVYAEDMNGKRRYIDTVNTNNENNLFALYADECGDEEEIILVDDND